MRFQIGKTNKSSSSSTLPSNGRDPNAQSVSKLMPLRSDDGFKSPDSGGSKEESFFEAKPWLDSDDEEFFSIKGDSTPSSGPIPNSRPNPSRPERRHKLAELLQQSREDDEHGTVQINTDGAAQTTNHGTDEARYQSRMNPGSNSEPNNSASGTPAQSMRTKKGCLPSLLRSCRCKKRKKQKKEHC